MAKLLAGVRWGYWVVCILFAAVLGLTGCRTGEFADIPELSNVAASPAEVPPLPDDPEGLIHAGDVLTVNFTDVPAPMVPSPLETKVQDDGTIKLYYSEVFKADGLTRSQLEQLVRDRYVPKYFTRLTVMINHAGVTRYYFIDGEVKQPGQKPYLGRIKVTEAIAAAAGFTDFANKKKVHLIRSNNQIIYVNAKAGACETLYRIPSDGRLNHRAQVVGGVLTDRCAAILTEFFAAKRR